MGDCCVLHGSPFLYAVEDERKIYFLLAKGKAVCYNTGVVEPLWHDCTCSGNTVFSMTVEAVAFPLVLVLFCFGVS